MAAAGGAGGGAPGGKGLQKLIILGDSGVGKTSLMQRYVNQLFSTAYKTTIGADFSTKDVMVGDDLITLQIWDTAGQERFQSLGQAFYRGADACVLVYDVSNAGSFEKLAGWRDQFVRYADIGDAHDFPFVVLGNKADLDGSRHAVSAATVKSWCDTQGGIPHFLVSAKTGSNVDDGFLTVVKAAAKRMKHDEPLLEVSDGIKIKLTPPPSSCAC